MPNLLLLVSLLTGCLSQLQCPTRPSGQPPTVAAKHQGTGNITVLKIFLGQDSLTIVDSRYGNSTIFCLISGLSLSPSNDMAYLIAGEAWAMRWISEGFLCMDTYASVSPLEAPVLNYAYVWMKASFSPSAGGGLILTGFFIAPPPPGTEPPFSLPSASTATLPNDWGSPFSVSGWETNSKQPPACTGQPLPPSAFAQGVPLFDSDMERNKLGELKYYTVSIDQTGLWISAFNTPFFSQSNAPVLKISGYCALGSNVITAPSPQPPLIPDVKDYVGINFGGGKADNTLCLWAAKSTLSGAPMLNSTLLFYRGVCSNSGPTRDMAPLLERTIIMGTTFWNLGSGLPPPPTPTTAPSLLPAVSLIAPIQCPPLDEGSSIAQTSEGYSSSFPPGFPNSLLPGGYDPPGVIGFSPSSGLSLISQYPGRYNASLTTCPSSINNAQAFPGALLMKTVSSFPLVCTSGESVLTQTTCQLISVPTSSGPSTLTLNEFTSGFITGRSGFKFPTTGMNTRTFSPKFRVTLPLDCDEGAFLRNTPPIPIVTVPEWTKGPRLGFSTLSPCSLFNSEIPAYLQGSGRLAPLPNGRTYPPPPSPIVLKPMNPVILQITPCASIIYRPSSRTLERSVIWNVTERGNFTWELWDWDSSSPAKSCNLVQRSWNTLISTPCFSSSSSGGGSAGRGSIIIPNFYDPGNGGSSVLPPTLVWSSSSSPSAISTPTPSSTSTFSPGSSGSQTPSLSQTPTPTPTPTLSPGSSPSTSSSSSPSSKGNPTSSNSNTIGGLSPGATAGISIFIILLVLGATGLAFLIYTKRWVPPKTLGEATKRLKTSTSFRKKSASVVTANPLSTLSFQAATELPEQEMVAAAYPKTPAGV